MARWTILGAALVLAACASGGGDGGDREWITDFEADIRPTAGFDVRGNARAVASVGRTVITVNLENGEPGAVHPWHVHQGECGSRGPIVGDAGDYPRLALDGDGDDREVATLDVQLDDDGDYYVNIHRSPEAMGTIVACGALVD